MALPRTRPGKAALVLGLALALFFATVVVAAASFVNFHDNGGYAHGLADGDNDNGFVRDYIHRDNGTNHTMNTQRYQQGVALGGDHCDACVTLDRGINPSINECHESVGVDAASPDLAIHVHFHANYCN
jgi:hypothetical protein